MAKTLVDLRAEKGLYLKDVATEIGVPEEELKAIEESGIMPDSVATKLVELYYLPDDYFTADSSMVHLKNPRGYFAKVSIVYYLIILLLSAVPIYANMIATSLNVAQDSLASVFSSAWLTAVELVGCILLANYVIKKINYVGDIKKYQFLHYTHTSGVSALLSIISGMITTFGYDAEQGINSTFFIWQGVNFIISLLGIVIAVIVHIKLFENAIVEDEAEKNNCLKNFAKIITISSLLAFVLTIVSSIIQGEFPAFVIIRRIFVYGLYIAVAWMVTLVKPEDEKKSKIAYTILPLISIIQGFVFSVINVFV